MTNSRFPKGRSTAALFTHLALAASGTALIFAGMAEAASPARPEPTGRVVNRVQAEKATAAYFTRLDVNGDGRLDNADLEAARVQVRNMRFDAADANRDGSISRVEFVAAKAGPDAFPVEDPNGRFGTPRSIDTASPIQLLAWMADSNHDGAISKDEFTAAAEKRFALLDSDQDGNISSEERHDARRALLSDAHRKWDADKATAN